MKLRKVRQVDMVDTKVIRLPDYLNPAVLSSPQFSSDKYVDYYLSEVAKKYKYSFVGVEPIATETEDNKTIIKYGTFLGCEDNSPVAQILPNRIFIQPAISLSGSRDDNAKVSIFASMLADDLKLRLYANSVEPVWIAAIIKGKELSIFDERDFSCYRFSDFL